MNTTDRQKEIIHAAFSLISEQGIQELTIKKIAAAVGVSEPAIYRHFSSKAEILESLVDEMFASRDRTLAVVRSLKQDKKSVLRRFFTEQARIFYENPSMTIMLFPEDIFRNNQALQEKIGLMMAETRRFIQMLLKTGIADGTFTTKTDPETVSLMLTGGFRLLVSAWHLEGHAFDLQERTKHFIEQALSMII